MTGFRSDITDTSCENPDLTATTPSSERFDAVYRYGSFIIAFLLIGAAVYCRIRLLDVPLERDEGGFAYIGQQLLRGVSPYHSGNMKILPGIHFAYAFIMMLFGESPAGIHTGLLLINLLSILFIYILARRILTVEAAIIASGSYAILSVSMSVFGVFAHATNFVVLFVLAGLIALLNGLERNSKKFIFISGLCLGISVLMKQHGIFFCLFAFCYLAGDAFKQKKKISEILMRVCMLVAGLLIPYAAVCFYMYANGVFKEFWFWTVTRSMDYAYGGYSANALTSLTYYFNRIPLNVLFFWVVALVSLALMMYRGNSMRRKWFVALWFLFSVLSILPGLAFYPHYFVLILPPLSILSGIAFETLPRIASPFFGIHTARMTVLLMFMTATIFTYFSRFEYLFTSSPYYVSRTIYGPNPFPESLEIARYIKKNSTPGTPIAVFGSEPQIYFYSDRPSGTDYLYMYPLVEQQQFAEKMQQEMMNEIKVSQPEYIVFVRVPTSWMIEGSIADKFLVWAEQYLIQNYRRVGVVEIRSFYDTKYYWDKEAENHEPASEYFVLVAKRIRAS